MRPKLSIQNPKSKIQNSLSSGLTLVELLTASVIFSILLGGLSAYLRGGTVAWRRTADTIEELQRLRVVCDRLAQDLANAVVLDGRFESAPGVVFARNALAFYTVRLARDVLSVGELWFVTYTLDGEPDRPLLLRNAQLVQEAEAIRLTQPEPLLSNVGRFSIRYGYWPLEETAQIDWRDHWNSLGQLPRLVEVNVELRGTPSTIQWPRRMRQIFVIPSGMLGNW